ncbi:MAG TPA: AraC family transcriptional regulator [Gemmatimonadaceae bacterium]|nr:AraC family transcriptional regulator [Gemmatimonadaceae bacterium]
MALIATLLPTPAALARLRAALRGRYSFSACADWNDLARRCAASPVSLAVVEVRAQVAGEAERLQQFRVRYPSIPVIVYLPTRTTLEEAFAVGRAGADAVLPEGEDEVASEVLALVERTLADGVGEFVRRAAADVKPTARDAIQLAVSRAHERLSPARLASLLGVRRKTLARRLAAAGCPNPQRLITWGRLIMAGRLLEDEQRSADAVAAALDFPSGSAFRNTCQRYLNASPRQIRARGGARFVVGALLRQIHSARREGSAASATPHVPGLAV